MRLLPLRRPYLTVMDSRRVVMLSHCAWCGQYPAWLQRVLMVLRVMPTGGICGTCRAHATAHLSAPRQRGLDQSADAVEAARGAQEAADPEKGRHAPFRRTRRAIRLVERVRA